MFRTVFEIFSVIFFFSIFDTRHQGEHINREFDGFVTCLTLAVGAFLLIMVVSAIGQAQVSEPKRVFLKDLETNNSPTRNSNRHNSTHHGKAPSTSTANSHHPNHTATAGTHHHSAKPADKP